MNPDIIAAVINLLTNAVPDLEAGTRIYYDGMVPEMEETPYVTVSEVSVSNEQAHDDPEQVDTTVVQINCVAANLEALYRARADAQRIRRVLNGYTGGVVLADGTVIEIGHCFLVGGISFWDEKARAAVVQRDYLFVHSS